MIDIPGALCYNPFAYKVDRKKEKTHVQNPHRYDDESAHVLHVSVSSYSKSRCYPVF